MASTDVSSLTSISSLGVGSGLELETLLTKLTTAQKARLTPITKQQDSVTAKINAYSSLSSALTTFYKVNESLSDPAAFNSKNLTTNSQQYFTITTESNAIDGNYNVQIKNLATSHSLVSSSLTDPSVDLVTLDSTFTLKLANGEEFTYTLEKGKSSLEDIADAINKSGKGVGASIIRSGDNSYQLSISSLETGKSNAIAEISSDNATLNNILAYKSGDSSASKLTQIVAAQDAAFSINGVEITNSSNTIENVISGISITLNSSTESATATQSFKITDNESNSYAMVEKWVNAYNALMTTFDSLSQYTSVDLGEESSSSNGALLGDTILRSVESELRSTLSSAREGTYKVLSEIGIKTDGKTGLLTIDDEDKLKSAISNGHAVEALFADDKTGIVTLMNERISKYTKEGDGKIAVAQDGLNDTLDDLKDRYDQVSDSIDTTIERYRTQFVQLDVLVTQLNSTSDYLTKQFDLMSNSKK